MTSHGSLRLVSSQWQRDPVEERWLLLEFGAFLKRHPGLSMQQATADFAAYIAGEGPDRLQVFALAIGIATLARRAIRAKNTEALFRLAFDVAAHMKLQR